MIDVLTETFFFSPQFCFQKTISHQQRQPTLFLLYIFFNSNTVQLSVAPSFPFHLHFILEEHCCHFFQCTFLSFFPDHYSYKTPFTPRITFSKCELHVIVSWKNSRMKYWRRRPLKSDNYVMTMVKRMLIIKRKF